jgi:phosphoribosylformylglycinamidine cyclo-ligase
MPGFYPVDEYDLAGFSVGVVDKEKIIDNSRIKSGDVLIALPSAGVHSNGFSLVRKVFNVESDILHRYQAELQKSLGDELLTPTKIYVKPVLALLKEVDVLGISHITGGGFYENIPRALPKGLCARIEKASVKTPPIFSLIAKAGSIPEKDMFNTFNMGVGMCLTVPKAQAGKALDILKAAGESAYVIGDVVPGEDGLQLW